VRGDLEMCISVLKYLVQQLQGDGVVGLEEAARFIGLRFGDFEVGDGMIGGGGGAYVLRILLYVTYQK